MRALLARLAVSVAVGLVGSLVLAPSAMGDEPGETDEGYVLVQQALSHLAHDSSHEGIHLAEETVHDALETEHQHGIDVPTLERAMEALETEDVEGAQQLLQDSISEALHDSEPATGMQTGTTTVEPELPGRSGLAAEDGGFLAASVIAVLLGAWLTFRFRPQDSIRDLRGRLAGSDGSTSQEEGSRR